MSVNAIAPELTRVGGEPALTWTELLNEEGDKRVRFARLGSGAEPVTLVESRAADEHGLFANWADRPGVVQGGGPDGALFAWWLAKSGDSTYAYSVHVARSDDLGATWRPLGLLHGDPTPAEHGFVSMVPEGDGVRAFWLDGRETVEGRPMTLRTVHVGERVERETEELLDESVCDCCNTAAVVTADGPLVVYRDRTGEEMRDHRAVRRIPDGWSAPYEVASDGWKIAACPVNGPAAAVAGDALWVAWFTAAGGEARVYAARSTDAGRTFSEPLRVDAAAAEGAPAPLGRLALVADPDGAGDAFVSWLGTADGADGKRVAVVRVRRLAAGPGGAVPAMGPVVDVARTESSRASGVPRMLFDPTSEGDRLLLAWVEPAADGGAPGGSRLRLAALPTGAVPSADSSSRPTAP